MKFLFFLIILVSFTLGCNTNVGVSDALHLDKAGIKEKFDPICGDEVIWHLHLQDGFKDDSITILIGSDTICRIQNISSLPNGCTNVFITNYKSLNYSKIFIKNMPHYNTTLENLYPNLDSIKLNIYHNNKLYVFNESLKYYNFYGLNYDSISNNFWYLKSNKCFVCW